MAIIYDIATLAELTSGFAATGTFESVAAAVEAGVVGAGGNGVFTVISGGAAAPVIEYGMSAAEVAAAAELAAETTKVATAGVGLAGSGTSFNLVALASMPVSAAAAAAAPWAGIALGTALYEENPVLWTKLSQKLLPFCYPGTTKIPAWVEIVQETGAYKILVDLNIIDAIKDVFEEEHVHTDVTLYEYTLDGQTVTTCSPPTQLLPGGEDWEIISYTGDLQFWGTHYMQGDVDRYVLHTIGSGSVTWRYMAPWGSRTITIASPTSYDNPDRWNIPYTEFPNAQDIIDNAPDIGDYPPTPGVEPWGGTETPVLPEVVPIIIIPDPLGPDYQPLPTVPVTPPEPTPDPEPQPPPDPDEPPEEWPEEEPWPTIIPFPWPDPDPEPGEDPWPEHIPWPLPVEPPEEWPDTPPEGWPEEDPWPVNWPDEIPYPIPFPYPEPTPEPSPEEKPGDIDDPQKKIEPYIDPLPWPEKYPVEPTQPRPDIDDPSQPDPDPSPDPPPGPTQPEPPPSEGEPSPPPIPIVPLPFSTTTGLISVYHPDQSTLLNFCSWLWVTWNDATIDKIWNNPFDGVITLFELYCTPTDVGYKNIRSGFLDSGISCPIISRYTEIDCGTIGVPEYYGNYLDYSPYSKAYVYLPFIGVVELNVDDIVGHGVNITYRIDEYNGSCIAMITVAKVTEVNGEDVTYSNIFYQFSGNCAVELPIAGGSQAAIKAGMLEAAAWGIGSVVSGIISGATDKQIDASLASGAASAVHSVVSAKSSVQHSGSFGSSYGAMGCKIPFLTIVRPKQLQIANYNELYGYPAHRAVRVGACTGFLRCREVHVISLTATDEEKKLIETLLKEGVYVTE